jgi:GTP cyclohydrolase IA
VDLTTFDADGYDEIVAVSRLPFYSLCEHHLPPFHGYAHIAFLAGSRILGLSKFARPWTYTRAGSS